MPQANQWGLKKEREVTEYQYRQLASLFPTGKVAPVEPVIRFSCYATLCSVTHSRAYVCFENLTSFTESASEKSILPPKSTRKVAEKGGENWTLLLSLSLAGESPFPLAGKVLDVLQPPPSSALEILTLLPLACSCRFPSIPLRSLWISESDSPSSGSSPLSRMWSASSSFRPCT
ncbi:hypothetical protein SDJN03_09901, partial [Cucurbita argyrosperma subsp. sororia]